MSSFFDEIHKNRAKSILLMLVFAGFFGLIVYALVILLGGGLIALLFGVVIIIAYAAFTYLYGDKFVLKMSGAKPADRNQYPEYFSAVEGLSAAAEVPTPKVYVINDPSPNAFATGRNKKVSAIAATTGLLSTMNRRELDGVVGHEMSHISNNDIQFMMVAIVFAGAIGIIAAIFRGMFFFGGFYGGGGNRNNGGLLLLLALVVGLLAPFFALLLRLAISRRREYMADANGARMTRDPHALADALGKIQQYTKSQKAQPVKRANEVTASLYFANPLSAKSVANLFSTHPPIEERIKRLEKMY